MQKITLIKNKFKKTLFWLLILTAVFSFTKTTAQKKVQFNYKQEAKKEKANYFDIVKKTRAKFAATDLTVLKNKKANKQFERWAYYWKNRISKDGSFPNENLGYFNAGILDKNGKIAKQKKLASKQIAAGETWTNIGPEQSELNNNGYTNFPQMGRLNTFLRIKHATDINLDVLFVGAPNGGIWKSTDGGSTWSPKLDMIAGIGVTDIKTVPGTTTANYTTQPIYVSTGDYDGGNTKSIGVLKSTDGGQTFNSTGLSFSLTDEAVLGDLIVADANTVFVGTTTGVNKTTDGGANWAPAFNSGFSGVNLGRAAKNGNEIMYTGAFGGVYYTSDLTVDSNWSTVVNASSNNKTAVTVDDNGDFFIQKENGQIRKFDKNNDTFSDIGSIPPGYNSQQGYNQALIVTDDLMITGEFNGQSSTDNGTNWTRTLNGYYGPGPEAVTGNNLDGAYIHSDHHRMGRLDGSLKFWSVNDGGLSFITFPSSTSVKPIIDYKSSKIKVTQSYSVSINPSANDGAIIMSNQDNDAFSKKGGTWYALAQGDGIQSAIDYNNPNIRYAGGQSGSISQTDTGFEGQLNGNGQSVQIGGLPINTNFYYPFEIHKTNPETLYAGGGNDVYILDASSTLSISAANSGLTTKVMSIATHGNSLIACTDTNIRFSSDQGANWSTITKPTDAADNLTSLDYDASNNQIIYATFSGYSDGKKVYKTSDGGTNWTNISGDLPNVVINEVILKQNQASEYLFLATEIGVYFSSNGGTNWSRLGENLPYANVKDLEIHYTADKLVAGTFGRGLWELSIVNSTLSTENINNSKSLELSLYPNPLTNGNLKISVKENLSDLSYEIYNVVGGVVKKGLLDSNKEINVTSLVNNIYLIRIYNSEYSSTKKFVLAK